MAFPFDAVTIDACFGGSLRQKLIATGPALLCPLDDVGTDPTDVISDRAVLSSISRGDPGMLPEYGCASGFNGSANYLTVAHAAALAPTTSFGIAVMLQMASFTSLTQTIFRKENGGTGGRIVVGLRPGASTAYRDAVIASGPSSYWRLDETAGTNAAATVGATAGTHSGATVNQTSLLTDSGSRAVLYDGSNDNTSFGDIHDFTGTAAMAVEFFIQPGTFTSGFARIVSKEITDGSGTQGWWIGLNQSTGILNFTRRLNGASDDKTSTTVLVPGTTYHVVCSYDGTNMHMYVNGATEGSAVASSKAVVNHAGALKLGSHSSNSNYCPCILDEVAIYTSHMSQVTAAAHYALHTSPGAVGLYVGANINAVYQEVEYTIASQSDWIANPRLIIARYTGSALQLCQVTSAGVVSTLATGAYSGAVATGTGSDIYVGANAAASEWFSGYLQMLTYWVNDYPSDAEITDFGTSVAWVSISSDVARSEGVEAQWGIMGSGPQDRIAGTGTLQLALRNSTLNSGGVVGYYSYGHSSARTGFGYGIPIRMTVVDPAAPSTSYRRFVGRLVTANPRPGLYGARVTDCLVVDYMDELGKAAMPAIGIVVNEDAYTIVRRLIDALPVKPHDIAVINDDPGSHPFAYGFDDIQDERAGVMEAIVRTMQSETGQLYVRGNTASGSQLTFEARAVRQLADTPTWTFTNSMHGFEASLDRADVITRVQVTAHPRTEDALATTVLYSIVSPIHLSSLETVTFRAPYTGPEGVRVGGKDLVTPVANVDYTGNSLADGTGSDYTANLVVTVTVDGTGQAGASAADVTLYNPGGAGFYVTAFQLRGRGVYTFQPQVAEVKDDARRAIFGDNALSIDLSLEDDITRAYETATFFLYAYGTERTIPRRILLRVGQGSPAALITAALRADVGDLVEVTETVSGIAAVQCWVNGVRTRIENGVVETELSLAPKELVDTWVLDDRDELDSGIVVGF